MDVLFNNNYDRNEAVSVLVGAVIIALNTGFINGVCMSPFFLAESDADVNNEFKINPSTQGVSGTGGSFTKSARYLVENNWPNYSYFTFLIMAYIGGAFIVGLITPRAHKHILEPTYGPTFFIAAIFLLCASLFATHGIPSRFIFYMSTAALGVQNGIASVYSANLIRCTLTGTSTDLGLIVAMALRGNFDKFIRGTLIAIIVTNYWIGGLIAVPVVKAMHEKALFVSVGLFALLGFLCLFYTMHELGVSFPNALLGTWKWKNVIPYLFEFDSDHLRQEDFEELFNALDVDGNDKLDANELRTGLEQSAKVKLTPYRLKALIRAADSDYDDCISRNEWAKICEKLFQKKNSKFQKHQPAPL
eukprot:jgi/Psemu1/227797/e_gw1.2147.3.1